MIIGSAIIAGASLAMIFVISLISALPIYFLYDWLIPKFLNWPHLTFWETWGFCLLIGMVANLLRGIKSK